MTHPGVILFGCMVWIPLAVWVCALVHWMIAGEIDALFGVPGICVAVVLGYAGMHPPAPYYSVIIFFLVIGTLVMFPILQSAHRRHALRALDIESLEDAYGALAMNQTNVGAKMRIARLIYEMGFPGHALAIAEQCLAAAPSVFFIEERRIVDRWRRTAIPPVAFEPIPCVHCGHKQTPGEVYCTNCQAWLFLDRVRGRVLPQSLSQRLLAVWITMVALIAGIPLVATLPGVLSLVGILAMVALGCAVMVKAFRSPEAGTA